MGHLECELQERQHPLGKQGATGKGTLQLEARSQREHDHAFEQTGALQPNRVYWYLTICSCPEPCPGKQSYLSALDGIRTVPAARQF